MPLRRLSHNLQLRIEIEGLPQEFERSCLFTIPAELQVIAASTDRAALVAKMRLRPAMQMVQPQLTQQPTAQQHVVQRQMVQQRAQQRAQHMIA